MYEELKNDMDNIRREGQERLLLLPSELEERKKKKEKSLEEEREEVEFMYNYGS